MAFRRTSLVWLSGALVGVAFSGVIMARLGLRALVRGHVALDLDVGRSLRQLGPIEMRIDAPRHIVFDVAAAPYGPNPPRDLRHRVEVIHRSASMVLAEHRTPVGRDVAVTLETVHLLPPERIEFRLVRGPVAHVTETFRFDDVSGETLVTYSGEMGTDGWGLGRWWGDRVAAVWEDAVRRSLEHIREGAVLRARARSARILASAPSDPGDGDVRRS